MKVSELATHTQQLTRDLLRRRFEVWLIGSRANGPIKSTSDWDFIVFGNDSLVHELAGQPSPDGIDLLVVTDGNRFRSPWPQGSDGIYKQGDLRAWKWSRKSETEATYEGTKFPDDWGTERNAIIVEE